MWSNYTFRKDWHGSSENDFWLVVSTHLKNISQIGNLPQKRVKIKKKWNHHLDLLSKFGISFFQDLIFSFQLFTSGALKIPLTLGFHATARPRKAICTFLKRPCQHFGNALLIGSGYNRDHGELYCLRVDKNITWEIQRNSISSWHLFWKLQQRVIC